LHLCSPDVTSPRTTDSTMLQLHSVHLPSSSTLFVRTYHKKTGLTRAASFQVGNSSRRLCLFAEVKPSPLSLLPLLDTVLLAFNRSQYGPLLLQVNASSTGVLQKLARVFKEKATQDFDRILKGTSKTREKLGVVEELFTYWVLEDADKELEELEDALIVSRWQSPCCTPPQSL